MNPNIAKQNSTIPAPMPVIALWATLSFLERNTEMIETATRRVAKRYKLESRKMLFNQIKCKPTIKATQGAT